MSMPTIRRPKAVRSRQGLGHLAAALATAALVALTLRPAQAQQTKVGQVDYVAVWAYGKDSGKADWSDLYRRDPIHQNQGIRTVPRGAAHLIFDDNTQLRVGSDAEVVIDEYVYAPARSLQGMSVNFTKGVMRVITGAMSKPAIKIRTPSATIGVRGTDFVVFVLANLTTLVYVLDGIVEITPNAGGIAQALNAGQSAAIANGATTLDTENVPVYDEDPGTADPGTSFDNETPGSGDNDSGDSD